MQPRFAPSLLIAAALLAASPSSPAQSSRDQAATPIRHLVVIFGENISFDHYFGTYPRAANPKGEPAFSAATGTPGVNGLLAGGLLDRNPNFLNHAGNGDAARNPFRLDRSQAATADQDHSYAPEQEAFHAGLMDSFPEYTGATGPPPGAGATKGLVMGYYDGNTVTALWNYAQHYALNDNSYGTTFGPSTPGAINLVSGQTNGVAQTFSPGSTVIGDGSGGLTLIGDANPLGDVCSPTSTAQVRLTSVNIGDLLNSQGVTWGWFEGGFNLGLTNPNGTTGCRRSTTSAVTGVTARDYVPHHEPFQYYARTANLTHARPSSVSMIGRDDAAHHQYDMDDFCAAVRAGNMPAVSFLKAPAYQDAHAGYSDPLDEQAFDVRVLDFLMTRPEWSSTAVVLAYDDSDGWYDHQLGQIVNPSSTPADRLTGSGQCGNGAETALSGPAIAHAQGRCGYGPRLPFLIVSPWAKANYVDHTLTDQTSVDRFIEDNWLGGKRLGHGSFDAIAGSLATMFDFHQRPNTAPYLLNPSTGEPQRR